MSSRPARQAEPSPQPGSPVRVVVVDDSAIVRKLLVDGLKAEPGIEVVGTAADPFQARDLIVRLEPDVITLDIEMPRMDGLSFLRKLMEHRPMPVIIISSLTQRGSATAIEALRAGAIDVIPKPGGPYSIGEITQILRGKILGIREWAPRADADPRHRTVAGRVVRPRAPRARPDRDWRLHRRPAGDRGAADAAAGGVSADRHRPAHARALHPHLRRAPRQDLPDAGGRGERPPGGGIRRGLRGARRPPHAHRARRRAARGPAVGRAGRAPPAPRGGRAVPLDREAARREGGGAAAHGHGAGRRRRHGRSARSHGAETIAEHEQSCVVFGMPREAIARGGAGHVASLLRMPSLIADCFARMLAKTM